MVKVIKFYSIPEWATHIAQDETGAWFAYEKKPYLDFKYLVWMGGGRREELIVDISSTLQQIK